MSKISTTPELDADERVAFQMGRLLGVYSAWTDNSGKSYWERLWTNSWNGFFQDPGGKLSHMREHFATMSGSYVRTANHIEKRVIALGGWPTEKPAPFGRPDDTFRHAVLDGMAHQRSLMNGG